VSSIRVAHQVCPTRAEGPFERCAIWVRGCSLACPGCCNPELWATEDPSAGPTTARPTEVSVLLDQLRDQRPTIEGLTLLGGEPLEQLRPLTALAQGAQDLGLGVLIFTGYTLAEARSLQGFAALWGFIDTLVTGRFHARELEPSSAAGGRRFIGSRNQRLHHRSSRYADPALWRGPNSAEIRIAPDGSVSVHGFPTQARALVRRLSR